MASMANAFENPRPGDRVLVLRSEWLDHILSGDKIAEVRGFRLHQGETYYLGHKSVIYGSAVVREARAIEDVADWRESVQWHLWDRDTPPYKRTFVHFLSDVKMAAWPVPYKHPRGAISIVRYHPPR